MAELFSMIVHSADVVSNSASILVEITLYIQLMVHWVGPIAGWDTIDTIMGKSSVPFALGGDNLCSFLKWTN